MTLSAEHIMSRWPYLLTVARNQLPTACPEVWEDITADGIEKALRFADRFDERGGAAADGWLAVIVTRTAVDYWRRTLSRETLQDVSERSLRTAQLDAGSDAHADVLDLRAALARLPEALREYGAGRAEDLGIVEAGARAGIPRATSTRRERELQATLRWLMRSGGGS